jgi:hypothetical protein
MKRSLALSLALALAASRGAAAAATDPGLELLATSYLRTLVCEQTRQFSETLAPEGSPEAKEVRSLATAWCEGRLARTRKDLDARYREQARGAFSTFIERYVAAEAAGDAEYLRLMGTAFGLEPAPETYAALQNGLMKRYVSADLQEASLLLGEAETWVRVRGRDASTPPLHIWMQRGSGGGAAAVPARPPSAVERLSSQEPEMPAVSLDDLPETSSLDDYAAERKKRREQIFEESQAAMDRVAAERKAAEEEYASKARGAAEADAEAMKQHAERLAASEEEATKQRERSWSNKIKGVVGTLASTFVGSVTSPISAQLAEKAVETVFK